MNPWEKNHLDDWTNLDRLVNKFKKGDSLLICRPSGVFPAFVNRVSVASGIIYNNVRKDGMPSFGVTLEVLCPWGDDAVSATDGRAIHARVVLTEITRW